MSDWFESGIPPALSETMQTARRWSSIATRMSTRGIRLLHVGERFHRVLHEVHDYLFEIRLSDGGDDGFPRVAQIDAYAPHQARLTQRAHDVVNSRPQVGARWSRLS